MKMEAGRLGIPRHYKGDLDIDRRTVEAQPTKAFAWAVYDCGTHLVYADYQFSSREGVRPSSHFIDVIEHNFHYTDQPLYWFWFDGVQLKPATVAQVKRRLDEETSAMARRRREGSA
jgi:hypothetical protein